MSKESGGIKARRDKPFRAWACTPDDVLSDLHVSPDHGLGLRDVRRRRRHFGRNQLRQAKPRSAWKVLLEQFKSLLLLLLLIASLLAVAFGDALDALAIAVVIVINTTIGFVTELRAIRSMEALRRLGGVSARVLRGGRVQVIPAQKLVPGDIVLIEGGDVVTADLRLLEASKLQADESMLTGESFPAAKSVDPVEEEAPLAERTCMLFKGTAVLRGSGKAVVAATGMRTELGRITALVEQAEAKTTVLEARLASLGRTLVWLTLAIAGLIAISGVLAGREVTYMVETAIALAVATVPEGLPIVATVALARGMFRMARRKALVTRLSAVETLGSTTVICTDKTGTLTENRMAVTHIVLPSGEVELAAGGASLDVVSTTGLTEVLELGALCNNASKGTKGDKGVAYWVGDPMEVALLEAAERGDIKRDDLLQAAPEIREEAFDPDLKMMATFHRVRNGFRVAVKGAPEAVIDACTRVLGQENGKELGEEGSRWWAEQTDRMAHKGLRVLALAQKMVDSQEAGPYSGLTLVGLVGMEDPPRKEVAGAIKDCREAGIQVSMVTGDQAQTARSIAVAVGLCDREAEVILGKELDALETISPQKRERILKAPVIARVSPKQKLDLVMAHRRSGAVVAMTGDGVNDAPALKNASIGVAMGLRGTQVAREAADMVLKDDNFATIVAAVRQGRIIFDNIRKFIVYLLSCNISEIMIIGLASVLNTNLRILPLQILFLNVVTDVFPALALGVGPGGAGVMSRPPRDPQEPVVARTHWFAVLTYGLVMTAAVFASFFLAEGWGLTPGKALTVAFLVLAFSQLWHVFNMRSPQSGILRNEITRNIYVWGALGLCTALLIGAAHLSPFSTVLDLEDPGRAGWTLILIASLVPLALVQMWMIARSLLNGRAASGWQRSLPKED